ncbi:MAG: helix-turn-helix transcriptional regulator [Deltaproteobacteria bacterium]|nr:helix-turn-helix transcriptional regulator [Deltaproteobacteria bacterium]
MRKARTDRGWSQRTLAEELDKLDVKLDPSAVTRIERGSREVKLREAVAIAAVLAVPLQDLAPPPTSSPRDHFVSCLASATEQGLAARQALASMSMYYAMALHLIKHEPELLAEIGAEFNGFSEKELESYRRYPTQMALSLVKDLARRQSRDPAAVIPTAEEADQLTEIVDAVVANLIKVQNEDSES